MRMRRGHAAVTGLILAAVISAVFLLGVTVAGAAGKWMALGSSVQPVWDPGPARGSFVASIRSAWVTVLDAGTVTSADNATITAPTTQVTRAGTHPIYLGTGAGQYVLVRLGYDASLSVTTNPVVKVFGRRSGGAWELLPTRGGALSITLSAASTDISDGTLKYTTPAASSTIDTLGCDEILVGVETALAGTGTTSTAIVQVRPL